jgi:hypothetical protein
VAGRKGNFSSKKCGCQRIESQDKHLLPGDMVSYKSIDIVCYATEAVNYLTEFFKLIGLTRHATA